MSCAVQLEDVSVGYHGKPVIEGMSLSIAEGEMAAVLGPNGAGKTTLMRAVTGLCAPLSGTVRLFGRDLRQIPPRERARLTAVVPQEVETPMAFTVEEVVTIGRTAALSRWAPPSRHDRAVVERAMVYTDVAAMKDRPLAELSGGEKQRVIVAMALAQEPRILLLDEATSHLDLNHRLEIMQIVERLNAEQQVTAIVISHDLNLAGEFCRRLVLLDRGRVAADGAPADVLKEDILRGVYQCDVRVHAGPTGSITVVPAPRLAPAAAGAGIRVHLIAGGGSGEEILRRLRLGQYAVTAGVLNEGDTDAEAAAALEVEAAMEKPFSPVGPAAIGQARDLVARADIVILAGVPFGPGNVANIDLAEQALAAGKRVLVMTGIETRDYSPGREASRRVEQLLQRGAKPWPNITDLFRLLSKT